MRLRLTYLILVTVVLLVSRSSLVELTRSPSLIHWRALNNGLRPHVTVFALAAAPDNPQFVLAATDDNAGLYLSEDGARHWHAWNDGLPTGAVYAVRFAPDAQTILVGTQFGVYTRTANAAHWTRLGEWPSANRVYALAFTRDNRLFAAADEAGVMRWNSVHWSAVGDERLRSALTIAAHPTDARQLAVGTGGHGVFISRDGGETWEASGAPTPFVDTYVSTIAFSADGQALYARSVTALYRSDDFGRSWREEHAAAGFDEVAALAFDQQRVYVGVAAQGTGILARDGLQSDWQRLLNGLHPRISISALAVAPSQPNVLYAGAHNHGTGGGVWRSEDRGQTWSFASDGLGAPIVYDIAIDARDERVVYAATWDGIYRTANGAETWELDSAGMDDRRAYSVAVSPQAGARVYAGTNDGGVYVSDGATPQRRWRNSTYVDETGISQVLVDPRDDRVAYAKVIFDRLFKTSDGGLTWQPIWNGIENSQELVSATIDPRNPDRLFAGATDGLYLTEDGGKRWQRLSGAFAEQTVFILLAHPSRARVWFAGATRGLYRSEDDGLHWQSMGLDDVTVASLAIDTQERLFIGTKYHGLFVMDDQGITRAGWPNPDVTVNAIRVSTTNRVYVATPQGVYRGERP